jgi:hypothetical protein
MSTEILLAVAAVLAIIAIVLIDRRVKKAGALFTDLTSPPMRLLALFLGVVFAGLLSMEFSVEWLIVSVALTTYGLGMPALLSKLQQSNTSLENGPTSKWPAFVIGARRWGIILTASGSAVWTAAWILTHAERGQALLIVLVVTFAVLGGVVGLLMEFGFWSDMIKRLFQ